MKHSFYSQSEKQQLFIEIFNFPFLENSADLYLMELIQLPFMVWNVYLINTIQKSLKPINFIILLMQGYFAMLLNIWGLL